MFRKLVVLFVVVGAVGAFAGSASTAAGSAQRLDIFGPNFEWNCALTTPLGPGPMEPSGSSAVLQYNAGQNSVGATVQLKGMAPDTTFQVRLIQGVADCFTIDGLITTNGKGNGTLHVSEAATNTRASVFVWGGTVHPGTGPFFMSDIFGHP